MTAIELAWAAGFFDVYVAVSEPAKTRTGASSVERFTKIAKQEVATTSRITGAIIMSTKGWFGFDLDGTVAFYESYGDGSIGAPIKPMIRRIKHYLKQGRIVKFVTARVAPEHGEFAAMKEELRIRRFLVEQFGEYGYTISITNAKDMHMIALFDDRAEQVIPNRGILVREELRRAVEALQKIASIDGSVDDAMKIAFETLASLDQWSIDLTK